MVTASALQFHTLFFFFQEDQAELTSSLSREGETTSREIRVVDEGLETPYSLTSLTRCS